MNVVGKIVWKKASIYNIRSLKHIQLYFYRLNISRLRSVNNLEVKSILRLCLNRSHYYPLSQNLSNLSIAWVYNYTYIRVDSRKVSEIIHQKNLSTVNKRTLHYLGRIQISNGFGTKICHHCELMFSFLCSL